MLLQYLEAREVVECEICSCRFPNLVISKPFILKVVRVNFFGALYMSDSAGIWLASKFSDTIGTIKSNVHLSYEDGLENSATVAATNSVEACCKVNLKCHMYVKQLACMLLAMNEIVHCPCRRSEFPVL
jgi:hypothetical protein